MTLPDQSPRLASSVNLTPRKRFESSNARRVVFSALLVSTLSAMGLFFTASPASAAAQKCTSAPYGYVCNSTYGSGAWVPQITAVRGKASGDLICNYSAHISVLDGRNHANVKFRQTFRNSGCTVGRAWFNSYPARHFSCGDVTSVAWFEDGRQEGGYANVKLC